MQDVCQSPGLAYILYFSENMNFFETFYHFIRKFIK